MTSWDKILPNVGISDEQWLRLMKPVVGLHVELPFNSKNMNLPNGVRDTS